MALKAWTDRYLDRNGQSCKHAGSKAGRQCTREGVGTGSLGLVTTLALLLIWRDRVDRQVDRQDGEEVTRLSVRAIALQAVELWREKVEHVALERCRRECRVAASRSITVYIKRVCDPSGKDKPSLIKTPREYHEEITKEHSYQRPV